MNVTCKCTIFKFTKKCQSQTKTRTETRYQHPPLTSEPTTMTLWYRVLKPPSLPTTIWHWDWAVGIKHHKALGSDIILLNFVKLSTLLIERDGHKRYTLPAALVVVWACGPSRSSFELNCADELSKSKTAIVCRLIWYNVP